MPHLESRFCDRVIQRLDATPSALRHVLNVFVDTGVPLQGVAVGLRVGGQRHDSLTCIFKPVKVGFRQFTTRGYDAAER